MLSIVPTLRTSHTLKRWIAALGVAVLLGGSPYIANAQDPVVPRIVVQPQVLTIAPPTFQAPFTVASQNRSVFTVALDAPGMLRARATWPGNGRLALILNGPSQTGYYAREDGSSPLSLSFEVTDELLERGKEWRLSIVQFGSGRPTEGTVAVTLPRAPATRSEPAPPAEDMPTADDIAERSTWRDVIGPNRFDSLREIAPGTVLMNQPKLLEDGSMRFRLPNGLIGQLSRSDTLTITDPEQPDSTQTIMLRSTNVQFIDPPDPPDELLSATGDLNAWWGMMQLWMGGMNERMRLSLEQAFSPESMEQFASIEADAGLDSPFERADYRLRYLENVLVSLLAQTAGEDAPPPN
jgi:hypothetical protein